MISCLKLQKATKQSVIYDICNASAIDESRLDSLFGGTITAVLQRHEAQAIEQVVSLLCYKLTARRRLTAEKVPIQFYHTNRASFYKTAPTAPTDFQVIITTAVSIFYILEFLA